MEIIVEVFIKSEKLLQILIKLLNPQILFCKSQTNLQIQELSLNPEKYFANPKKYFDTCYWRQQSTSVRICFRHFALSKMAEERVWVNIFNGTAVCPLCMIRVNCISTLGVLSGMMNPQGHLGISYARATRRHLFLCLFTGVISL